MKAKDLRAVTRVPVTQRGSLKFGDTWKPCLILDMSESGILLMSNLEFPVGITLDFKCELFPGRFLKCKLEVKHVKDTEVGTKIVEIDSEGAKLCRLYLQEHFSNKLDDLDD